MLEQIDGEAPPCLSLLIMMVRGISWIKGSADSVHAMRMIHKGTLLEAQLEVQPYFCRVPTMSNIADGPSRLDFRMCFVLGAEEFKVPMDILRKCAIGQHVMNV